MVDNSRLDAFRHEVNLNLANGALSDVDLAVTSDDGGHPVVVALEEERLSVVLGRVRAVGGFANLFVLGDGRVHVASFIEETCAIALPDDKLTGDDSPGAAATVGMFLDYVASRPGGVVVSEAVGHPARARDARIVEFA